MNEEIIKPQHSNSGHNKGLDKKKKYLQIALNSTLDEAYRVINSLPKSDRIILEAGTPLIKRYGTEAISRIRFWYQQHIFGMGAIKSPIINKHPLFSLINQAVIDAKARKEIKVSNENSETEISESSLYIVADLKCMDRGATEVEIAKSAGANAAVALGHAPIETLDTFIEACETLGIDSMIDMMNYEFPLTILRQLEKLPQVVILHRGVDEEHFNKEKEIPFFEINRIKNEFDVLIAIAGGDTFQEVQRAAFNDADIVVVWKSFYTSSDKTAEIAEKFLKEIR